MYKYLNNQTMSLIFRHYGYFFDKLILPFTIGELTNC